MGSYRIAVVALGKIGLPLAAQFASKGHTVIGADVNPEVVATVNAGRSHVLEEPGLAERVAEAVAAGRLRATTDTTAAVRESEVVVVVVPLLVDEEANLDLCAIDAATEAIGRGLQPGTLVIYETTLPVGTTRDRLGPALAAASPLSLQSSFHLAFSPERVYSGRIFEDLRKYPKVVGGVDAESTRRAAEFYRAVLDAEVLEVANAETAEFTKLVETTYRDVNIALANEFAIFAGQRGIDALQAIRAANTQPFSHVHTPGVGVGGHCIPVYPYFLINYSEGGFDIPRLARRVNDGMAIYATGLLRRELGSLRDRTVLILGLAYREDVKETAFSSALRLHRALAAEGARVIVNDPLYTPEEIARYGMQPVDLDYRPEVHAIVLQAYHSEYRSLDFGRFRGLRVVVDGRNVLDRAAVAATGAKYLGIGRS